MYFLNFILTWNLIFSLKTRVLKGGFDLYFAFFLNFLWILKQQN